MTSQRLWLAVLIVLLSHVWSATKAAIPPQQVVLPRPVQPTSPSTLTAPSTHHPDDDFVRVDGLRFVDGNGAPFFAKGINYWPCMHLAAQNSGGNVTRLRADLNALQGAGVNVLRIMAASEGAPTPQPFRAAPALLTSPNEWNEDMFQGLDLCVAEAAQRDMRVVIVLGNTWQWTGGVAQYVSWANDDEAIPYPRGWDLHAEPQRKDGYTGWGAWVREGVEENAAYMAFQARFYSDVKAQRWYRKHVERVLGRTNTVTGVRYIGDAAIMAWEPINEPQPVGRVGDAEVDAMIEWHHRTSALIKHLAPKQLSTTGFEAKQGKHAFVALHNHSAIDFACAHIWAEIWGHYDMLDKASANLERATMFATTFLADVERWSREIGKPVVLEEFGMARDNWHNIGTAYLYNTATPTTHRDAYFAHLFAVVRRGYAAGTGWAGLLPWSYGGTLNSATQRVNAYDMLLAGDPPQEPPGWFSILQNDSTMAMLKQWNVRP